MMEILCPPMCAATNRLHLGNLYTWVLIDSYKRAAKLRGERVIARESWNCMSKKLEEEVISQNRDYSNEKIMEECSRRTNSNIDDARKLFKKYSFEFDLSVIRDDSVEYGELVNKKFEELMRNGRIDKNYDLSIPSIDQVIEKAKTIEWIPENIWKRYHGIDSMKGVEKIPVLREGIYGVAPRGVKNKVFGQRFVQSFLPSFYEKDGLKADIGIFGMDLLTIWIYPLLVNNEMKPFDRVGLSGIALNSSGKKISKYDPECRLANQISDHPDNVRLFLLRQSFGSDFKIPIDFRDEEKLRRKTYNCLVYLKKHSRNNEDSDFSHYKPKLKDFASDLSKEFHGLNFLNAHRKFYDFFYEDISKVFIDEVKNKGICKKDLNFILDELTNLSEIFMPNTIKDFKVEK